MRLRRSALPPRRLPGVRRCLAVCLLTAAGSGAAHAEPATDVALVPGGVDARSGPVPEELIVVGTRGAARTAMASPLPVDLFDAAGLLGAGAVGGETGQAIANLAPSFNFPRQSNSGTSDHVRAGQLRGLGPDQLLVLVNGKRRHGSAIVNSETKIGRGAAAVDFNAIPLGAIASIEVLRDGAGALYGSDAIAGVVNVRLDDAPDGGLVRVTWGGHPTSGGTLDRDVTDGESLNIDASVGMRFDGGGTLRVGVEAGQRAQTQRAGLDGVPFFVPQTPANLALRGGRNYAEGDPETRAGTLWFSGALPFEAVELYAFGIAGERRTEGAAFFRYPDGTDNLRTVNPEGFLPRTRGESRDASLVLGGRGVWQDWHWDGSVDWGRNAFRYGVDRSLNASLGEGTPRFFRSGDYGYDIASLTFDARCDFGASLFEGHGIHWGLELRREQFDSDPGEPASFAAGPLDLAIGAQGAPGLTPADAARAERWVRGAYVGGELRATDAWRLDATLRVDDHSDFGPETAMSMSTRYELDDVWALRASASRNGRAPALQQQAFADRSVNFGDARRLVVTRTTPVDDPIAGALGAESLEAETAVNLGLGVVAQWARTRLSVDAFDIRLDDRIVLSERFFGAGLERAIAGLPGADGVASVRFFANAVDTRTRGIDVLLEHERTWLGGALGLRLAYSYARTRIRDFAATPAALLAIDPSLRLVGPEEVNTIESATPRSKAVLAVDWARDAVAASVRLSRFGSAVRVFNFGGGFVPRQRYGAEYSLDASLSLQVLPGIVAAVGGTNLLDRYPDRSGDDINFFGNLPYDILSPIGVNGRYVYARLEASL